MNTKTPPNTAAIKNLKSQGFHVTIRHYRKKLLKDKKQPLLLDRAIRENQRLGGFGYEMISQRGGMTEMQVSRNLETFKVIAICHPRDSFCKRTGVSVCLARLSNILSV